MNDSTYSVIIINTNSPYIGFTIQSVLDWLPSPEIIIVEDELARPNLELITMFDTADITILDVPTRFPGELLNRAIEVSTKDNIMIISDRAVIKNFVGNTADVILKSYSMLFGRQQPVWNGKRVEKTGFWKQYENKIIDQPFTNVGTYFQYVNNFAIYDIRIIGIHKFPEDEIMNYDIVWGSSIVKELEGDDHVALYAPHCMEIEYNLPVHIT